MRETRSEKRRLCWESVFPDGTIQANCPVCGTKVIRYQAPSGDTFQKLHIIPKCQDGPDESWNLLPGCGCNQNMSSLNLVDWMGTKGGKMRLMKPLFLMKYKSLVPPIHRSSTDERQLIRWLEVTYEPELLYLYEEWLILSKEELEEIGSLFTGERKSPHFSPNTEKGKKLVLSGKPIY